MPMTSWIWAAFALADASPATQRIDAIEEAWSTINAYCSDFALGFHSETGSALSRGERCWDRRGRMRTATQHANGTVIDIRGENEVWYSHPDQPVVLHLQGPPSADEVPSPIGHGIGELVSLVVDSAHVEEMGSVDLNGQETWRFRLTRADRTEAIVFVNSNTKLPVALELRKSNRAIMSYGLMNLTVDPLLPADFFRIQPTDSQRLVELNLDPNASNSEEVLRTLENWRRQ